MANLMSFSANVINAFEGKNENYVKFDNLMMDASNGIYTEYSKEQVSEIIRNQFDRIMGINYKEVIEHYYTGTNLANIYDEQWLKNKPNSNNRKIPLKNKTNKTVIY